MSKFKFTEAPYVSEPLMAAMDIQKYVTTISIMTPVSCKCTIIPIDISNNLIVIDSNKNSSQIITATIKTPCNFDAIITSSGLLEIARIKPLNNIDLLCREKKDNEKVIPKDYNVRKNKPKWLKY